MNSLKIESSKNTPEVNFDIDNNTLTLLKVSKPENAHEFYQPLFDFIDQFEDQKVKQKQVENISIDFKFIYFNTATVKVIYELLDKFKNIQKYGISVNVNWYYDPDDDDMLEEGELISQALNLPFNYKPLEEDLYKGQGRTCC